VVALAAIILKSGLDVLARPHQNAIDNIWRNPWIRSLLPIHGLATLSTLR